MSNIVNKIDSMLQVYEQTILDRIESHINKAGNVSRLSLIVYKSRNKLNNALWREKTAKNKNIRKLMDILKEIEKKHEL